MIPTTQPVIHKTQPQHEAVGTVVTVSKERFMTWLAVVEQIPAGFAAELLLSMRHCLRDSSSGQQ